MIGSRCDSVIIDTHTEDTNCLDTATGNHRTLAGIQESLLPVTEHYNEGIDLK